VKEFADVWNAAARAVKAVDPKIKVGGPAAARADLHGFAREFARLTKDHLDFYSVHAYASGSAEDTTESILDRPERMVAEVAKTRKIVQTAVGRPVPVFLNEFNISWTWETRDQRMTNHVGAVFDAHVLFGAASVGIEATAAWNERDGVYGKTAGDGTLRPSAHLYASLNPYGIGDIVRSSSGDSRLVAFAVKRGRVRTLWVVNRSTDDVVAKGLPRIAGNASVPKV
jgi:hypothetical protein